MNSIIELITKNILLIKLLLVISILASIVFFLLHQSATSPAIVATPQDQHRDDCIALSKAYDSKVESDITKYEKLCPEDAGRFVKSKEKFW